MPKPATSALSRKELRELSKPKRGALRKKRKAARGVPAWVEKAVAAAPGVLGDIGRFRGPQDVEFDDFLDGLDHVIDKWLPLEKIPVVGDIAEAIEDIIRPALIHWAGDELEDLFNRWKAEALEKLKTKPPADEDE